MPFSSPIRIAASALFVGTALIAQISHAQIRIYDPTPTALPDSGDPEAKAESGDSFSQAVATGDFNGDGHEDLAIGAPMEKLGANYHAGAVSVFYGTPEGITDAGSQFFHQGNVGSTEGVETGDFFGDALAAGDFNCDGFSDLAIGAPLDHVGPSNIRSGSVTVMYGSQSGLTTNQTQLWHQGLSGVGDGNQSGDQFGLTLAVGNFDDDIGPWRWNGAWRRHECDDLAIGAPYDDYGSTIDAGAVEVLYGHASGLVQAAFNYFHPFAQEVQTDPVPEARFSWGWVVLNDNGHRSNFGAALAAGDFNGDSVDDLAVGVPGYKIKYCKAGWISETCDSGAGAGYVRVLSGARPNRGRRGLSAMFNGFTYWKGQSLYQKLWGIPGRPESGDRFGSALAAGDYNGDGRTDLAIGAPGEDIESSTNCSGGGGCIGTGTFRNAGSVTVVYASGSQLNPGWNQSWHRGQMGDTLKSYENFGSVLAAGDFFGRGEADDLAIGVPWSGSPRSSGIATLLPGNRWLNRLDTSRREHVGQGMPTSVPGTAEYADYFGSTLATGDFDGDGSGDLAIGVPGDNLPRYQPGYRNRYTGRWINGYWSTQHSAGALHVFYGGYYGPDFLNSDLLAQDGLE